MLTVQLGTVAFLQNSTAIRNILQLNFVEFVYTYFGYSSSKIKKTVIYNGCSVYLYSEVKFTFYKLNKIAK